MVNIYHQFQLEVPGCEGNKESAILGNVTSTNKLFYLSLSHKSTLKPIFVFSIIILSITYTVEKVDFDIRLEGDLYLFRIN